MVKSRSFLNNFFMNEDILKILSAIIYLHVGLIRSSVNSQELIAFHCFILHESYQGLQKPSVSLMGVLSFMVWNSYQYTDCPYVAIAKMQLIYGICDDKCYIVHNPLSSTLLLPFFDIHQNITSSDQCHAFSTLIPSISQKNSSKYLFNMLNKRYLLTLSNEYKHLCIG